MKNSSEIVEMQDVEPVMSTTEVLGFNTPEQVSETDEDLVVPPTVSQSAYDVWKENPTADNLYAVTKDLKPTIDSVIASMGAAGNPQIAAKARVIAAKAVRSYDPSLQVGLPTWVSNQLRQLTRDVRKSNSVLHVPDRVFLDGYAIHKAEAEFEDENGREPTLEELADASHLSVKRIKTVRNKMRKVGTENPDVGENDSPQAAVHMPNYTQEALDYVYGDSDRTDKLILEYLTGYGGKGVFTPKEVMQKLKLTPVQLTRRKIRLAERIKEISNDLESLQ